jgi:hypothetical protein
MAYFDAFATRLFHTDSSGRRLYVPPGTRRAFLVPDEATERRVARSCWRATHLVGLAAGTSLLATAIHPALLLGIPLAYVGYWLHVRAVFASLTPAGIDARTLPRDRAAERARYYRALGWPAVRAQILGGAAMIALGVFAWWAARTDPTPRAPIVRLAAIGLVVAGTVLGVQYGLAARRYFRAGAPTAP